VAIFGRRFFHYGYFFLKADKGYSWNYLTCSGLQNVDTSNLGHHLPVIHFVGFDEFPGSFAQWMYMQLAVEKFVKNVNLIENFHMFIFRQFMFSSFEIPSFIWKLQHTYPIDKFTPGKKS
jgi:hypothetical protein